MRFYLFTSISGLIAVFIPSFIGSVRLILEGSDADDFDSNFSNQYAIVERPNYPIIGRCQCSKKVGEKVDKIRRIEGN